MSSGDSGRENSDEENSNEENLIKIFFWEYIRKSHFMKYKKFLIFRPCKFTPEI